MKVLVTGVCGGLGYDVACELLSRGITTIGTDILDKESPYSLRELNSKIEYIKLDITNEQAVFGVIDSLKPNAVIHCSAWTNVDGAEDVENHDKVFSVNHKGTEYIAKACKMVGAKMVYISTDYVFSGTGETPYLEDDKNFSPLNVYGKSKFLGEMAVSSILEKYFIVRTAWVFGVNNNNFVKTMLNLGKKLDAITVVNDQIGTPTYTLDLARLLVDMVHTEKYGYYHATNEGGYISWYDFAKEIFKIAGYGTNVLPISTKDYKASKAKRPYNSRLNKTKLKENGFTPLPDYKNALERYLKIIL